MCARKSAWDKKPEISATYTDSKARDVIAAGSHFNALTVNYEMDKSRTRESAMSRR